MFSIINSGEDRSTWTISFDLVSGNIKPVTHFCLGPGCQKCGQIGDLHIPIANWHLVWHESQPKVLTLQHIQHGADDTDTPSMCFDAEAESLTQFCGYGTRQEMRISGGSLTAAIQALLDFDAAYGNREEQVVEPAAGGAHV